MRIQSSAILALFLCGAPQQSMAADQPVPIPVAGWNADVVYENSAAPFATFFDIGGAAWFETGSGGRKDGLPVDRVVESLITPGLDFVLQPYDQPNVLRLDPGRPTNTLVLAKPMLLSVLHVLAASGNGGGNGTVTLVFADGSRSLPMPFIAPDWWDGTAHTAPRRPAAKGFGRILNDQGGTGPWRYSGGGAGFSLHQTDLPISTGVNGPKLPLMSLEFVKANRAGPDPGATSVFALAGIPAPVPPPVFVPGSMRTRDGVLEVDFATIRGLTYTVETSSNLLHWVESDHWTATNSLSHLTSVTDHASGFLRLRVVD